MAVVKRIESVNLAGRDVTLDVERVENNEEVVILLVDNSNIILNREERNALISWLKGES